MPSKSNEERLLLVSPGLASVLATIIKRLRDTNGGKIPLVSRHDSHERVTGPHLFQRRPYWQSQVLSEAAVKRLLDRTLECTGLRDQAGEPLRYTPHDFRRMFATEAATGGLPVHIAARILGHKTLTTTQAYLAVFQDDLIGPTAASSTVVARSDPKRSTASPPPRSGATSSSTSNSARSHSAPADGPTEPPASTNTPASAALSSRWTPARGPASSRSSRTSANASARPAPTAGSGSGCGA